MPFKIQIRIFINCETKKDGPYPIVVIAVHEKKQLEMNDHF